VILALHDLNTAVEGKDLKATLRALQNPGFKVVEYISSTDAVLYFRHLLVRIRHFHIPSNISIALVECSPHYLACIWMGHAVAWGKLLQKPNTKSKLHIFTLVLVFLWVCK
jgi:hypothetical protein